MAKFSKKMSCVNCRMKINIFNLLSDDELEEVNASRSEVLFNRGETLFKQGGPLTHIACITSGMAKIYLEDARKKKNIILRLLRPGDMVGGPGLFVDFRNHFTVTAIAETRACFIDINIFQIILERNTQFNKAFIKYLNSQTIRFYEKTVSLTFKQMPGRLADTLLYLSNDVYGKKSFSTSLSRQDIAELSSMTKESAIRILKDFRNEGILQITGDHFEIVRDDILKKISSSG